MISYLFSWLFLGFVSLVVLCVQDFRKRRVDDRRNYLMYGATFMLLTHVSRVWWYLLSVVVIVVLLSFLLKRFVGRGDVSSFGWLFLGFAWLGVQYLLVFFLFFSFCTVAYRFGSGRFRSFKPAFMPVFLISFVASSVICFRGLL